MYIKILLTYNIYINSYIDIDRIVAIKRLKTAVDFILHTYVKI